MSHILITGAAKRIGAQLAKHLWAQGHSLFLHFHQSEEDIQKLSSELKRQRQNDSQILTAFQANLADQQDIDALCQAIKSYAQNIGTPLSGLINNASLFRYDKFQQISAQMLDAHFAINSKTPILLAQAFQAQCPADGKSQDQWVINMLDNKLFSLNPDFFSYTISKAGLQAATTMLAMAMAPTIRVNGIAPGITLISGDQDQAEFERAHQNNPLKRGCEPEDILAAVDFIQHSPCYTGQVMILDGGQVLQRRPRDVNFL